MTDSLYKEIILDHYRNSRNFGHLVGLTHFAALHNPFCGDRIRIDIKREGEHIADINFSGNGCALSMASASLLTEQVKGKPASVVGELTQDTLLALLGIEVGAVRLKCVMLPLEVLKKVGGFEANKLSS